MTLNELICNLANKYIADGLADTREEINQGLCEGFASDIQDMMPEVDILAVEELMIGHNGDPSGCDVFDWEILRRHWGISPPNGCTPADVGRMVIGGHFWITHQGKHYDAECPDGADSFFDLPYFHRQIEAQRDMAATHDRQHDETFVDAPSPS